MAKRHLTGMLDSVKLTIFELMSHFDLSSVQAQLSDSSRAIADITANMVYEDTELLKVLFDLSWADKEPWSMRASRVVSICCCRFPELAKPYVSDIISRLLLQKSESARRNFLKIFSDTDIKLKNRDKSLLLNACFDLLSRRYSIAVRAYSMNILYRLSIDLPDIQKELYEVLSNEMEEYSVGMKSLAKKILKKLGRQD
jgi:hypothetical protein